MIHVVHHSEGKLTPYFYFALEDYILNEVLKGEESFFFTWVIKGVVIGKNQIIENEVNLEYLRSHGILLFRRPTGGGTVYADENNTMFSIVAKKSSNFSFKAYLSPIIEAINKLGIHLEFSGRNDILFDGKKVSGNAFLQNKNGMLLHGTLLYDCDLETMIRAITPDDEKLVSKGIESVRSRVTNLKPFLGNLTQDQLVNHITREITDKEYVLSEAEVTMLLERAHKYSAKSYIYHQTASYTKRLSRRIKGGYFNLSILLQEGKIQNLTINGDFFELQPLENFIKPFIGVYYNKEAISQLLPILNFNEYFLDVALDDFLDLLYSGIIE